MDQLQSLQQFTELSQKLEGGIRRPRFLGGGRSPAEEKLKDVTKQASRLEALIIECHDWAGRIKEYEGNEVEAFDEEEDAAVNLVQQKEEWLQDAVPWCIRDSFQAVLNWTDEMFSGKYGYSRVDLEGRGILVEERTEGKFIRDYRSGAEMKVVAEEDWKGGDGFLTVKPSDQGLSALQAEIDSGVKMGSAVEQGEIPEQLEQIHQELEQAYKEVQQAQEVLSNGYIRRSIGEV